MTVSNKKVVVIGGGTGTYTTILGLKKYPLDISVIVSMTDSGGSNRILRDEFGLLPTSDIRQAMVALADDKSDELLRQLFTYRYTQGTGISGMTFGNLFMVALTDILGSQEKAIDETCRLLDVKGRIIPVTLDVGHLVARYDNGRQVLGEHQIDEPTDAIGEHRIIDLEIFPKVQANPAALQAISEADLIILAPGDLYTSLLSNIIVPGISKALTKSKAKKAYVVNLMTKFGQTNHFTASDHLFELYKYLSGGIVDYCLVSKLPKLNTTLIKRYKDEKAEIVIDDLDDFNQSPKPKFIRADLVSKHIFEKPKSDSLVRSLIRHDPDKLAKAIVSLI